MKLIKKIKKVIATIVLAIISFPNKILAVINPGQCLYGPAPASVSSPSAVTITIIRVIARIFIIPIALLIGLIIYCKKSKSSKKKKISVTIGIIAITAILYFVVDKII